MKAFSLIVLVVFSVFNVSLSGYPIALFHGLGDFCLDPLMIEHCKYLGENSNNICHCFESGGLILDYVTSFHQQAHKACERLKANTKFNGKDISVVGFSQGGLIARYIAEECDFGGQVKRLITLGGPHMGVASFPNCVTGKFCDTLNNLIDYFVYTRPAQLIVGPAGYFNNYKNEESFIKGSTFLAELNNLTTHSKNADFKKRMLNLEKLVLIQFSKDTMIIPKETAWFQFFDANKNVLPFEKTDVYEKDLLGLKTLHDNGKIEFFQIEGDHLEFSDEDIDKFVIPYLK